MVNNFLKGILIGISNVIPGVSGGTIAVVLGIFDQLIESVNNFYKDFKNYFAFLAPLGMGAVIGILLLSKIIDFCLANYVLPTNFFFIGLVCGSLPIIYKKAVNGNIKLKYIISLLVALIAVVSISVMSIQDSSDSVSHNIFYIFIGGVISASAMIVPGISGSFMMIVLGLYYTVISAVSNFNLSILLPFGFGVIIGILLVSKIIELLLKRFYALTYFAILGLVIGSIVTLIYENLTYIATGSFLDIIVSLFTFIIGFFISYFLGRN